MQIVARIGAPTLALTLALAAAPTTRAEPQVRLSGFVDTSLSYGLIPDAAAHRGVTLGLDQVEVDVDVAVAPGLRLRTDLNVYPASGVDTSGGPAPVFDRLVEQGFAEWFLSGGADGLFLRAGKWNAPVGFEVTDPTGLWQYSQGLLFTHATPTNLTGFAFGWVGATTQLQAWVTNDWDTPSTGKDATIGGRVQQGVGDVGTIGLSATYGALVDDPARLMIDLDAALAFGALKLGAELNFGKQGDRRSLGALLAVTYALSDVASVTARVDWLDRELLDLPYKGMSLTGAGLFTLTPGLTLVAELRADLPDAGDTALTAALELTAAF